jgi:motility quorum-sensing regulator / GCU-specific mRNA interferase toxin
MEKRKPHYPLSRVKEIIRQGRFRVTRSAFRCAINDFGYKEPAQLADCVLALAINDFDKSMTTHHDSRLWQDVYHPMVGNEHAYVKIQIVDDTTVVISFKLLEDE